MLTKRNSLFFGSTESKDMSVNIDGQKIKEKTEAKYLGVTIDKKLTFQSELKNILRIMAQGIKSIYTLRNCVPESFKKTLINSLVISHLQYPAALLLMISESYNNSRKTIKLGSQSLLQS